MMLRKIKQVGAAGVAEWREMWNGEVLPLLQRMKLVAGGGITINEYSYGTVIDALPVASPMVDAGGAAVPDPYNSYFKITMAAAGSSSYRVTVADGATGSNSYAVVNGGSTYTLPPYRETITSGALYLLKYTPAQYNSGGSVVSSATMVLSSIHQSGGTFPVLPSGGTDGAYYYQIGRVIWSSGSALTQVAQDHTAGVVYFQWFINCNQYAQ